MLGKIVQKQGHSSLRASFKANELSLNDNPCTKLYTLKKLYNLK